MKYLLVPVILLLSGCGGSWNQFKAHMFDYTSVCVKETGVMYVQFPTGVAPLYNLNGTLVSCK